MKTKLTEWMGAQGVPVDTALFLLNGLLLCVILLLCYFALLAARKILVTLVGRIVRKSAIAWDNIFLERKLFSRLAHIAPALVLLWLGTAAFPESPGLASFLGSAASVYLILILLMVADALLNAALDIYDQFAVAKQIPVKGFIQALKIGLFFIAGILVLSVVTGKSPLVFFSGLGALTAVLMLIFKDAILGFVAGIQLSANNMVRKGDWIEMPQFGADGDVLDVSLTTVKVQNWDKTITTIPTYALISHSFKNWRGMQESGGRRIKRALYLDMTSIRFCDEALLERFSQMQLLRPYLEKKQAEIEQSNREQEIDDASPLNGRRLTNIGMFRAYLEAYLRHHPKVHQGMTFLVRQLAPTDRGLPLEIYVFSSDQVWANYEAIQADIFDHLLAALPEFELRIFQNPTGSDFSHLSRLSQRTQPAS
jgi:miniconductance mechanosensitive channel